MGVSSQRLSGLDHSPGSKRRHIARAGPLAPQPNLHAGAVWRLPGLRRRAQYTGPTIWLGTSHPLCSSSPALSLIPQPRASSGFAERPFFRVFKIRAAAGSLDAPFFRILKSRAVARSEELEAGFEVLNHATASPRLQPYPYVLELNHP